MKLMFVSDIHGSAYYCEKMLDCYTKENADKDKFKKLCILKTIFRHPNSIILKDY